MRSIVTVASIAIALILSTVSANAQLSPEMYQRAEEIAQAFTKKMDFATLFTPTFLAQVPEPQLTGLFQQYATNFGGVTHWYFTDSTGKWQAQGKLNMARGYSVIFYMVLEDKAPYRIAGMRIMNATPLVPSIDSLIGQLSHLPGITGLRIEHHKASPKHSDPRVQMTDVTTYHEDTTFGIGSSFKLWVLAALVKGINSGSRHWSDVIDLDAASRSLPSGRLQTWPVGTPLTLATAASMMISESDNTAADLLLRTLGQEAVSKSIPDAPLALPILTTSEMFKLKTNPARTADYLSRTPSERQRYLSKQIDPLPLDSIQPWGEPRAVRSVEWLATPRMLTNVMKWIWQNTTSDSNLARGILAINPGVHVDRKYWKYVGYKGGSEPGVIAMNYLLESQNGDWYTLSAAWNNPDAPLDEAKFEGLIERAIELLAEHP